ncbi:hypothetical protein LTR09_000475 [Extremus antarcticus]|uniref:Uncharacterized protein n=1 Tax=Extremus antarcticus TaxID=702011 RepID=A0AAJ0GJP5_9PEZI|nr:hypothetical protein LTR09_000475 [Extremus antarcticus]
MTTALPDPHHCPLLSLPPELRLTIYENIYSHPRRCTLQIESLTRSFQFPPNCAGAANVLLTSRQLHDEVLPILYSMTTFKLIIFGTREPLGRGYEQFLWPRDSGNCLKHVRKLELCIHIMDLEDSRLVAQRLGAVARQIPQERRLESCTSPDVPLKALRLSLLLERFVSVVKRLDERPGLSVAERDVCSRVKAEALRLMEAESIQPDGSVTIPP